MKYVDTDSFLALREIPIVDVRSPGEFSAGHIPGACSIPLFSDDQRAEVGTTYTQDSQEAAVREGLRYAGANMNRYIQAIERLNSPAIRMHCWRGGMRSESMAWLSDKLVEKTYVLTGGYKAYRRKLMEFFNQPLPVRIITGNTGSGKTRVLQELRGLGQQVIDLEGLANHQGSSFGNQKTTGQPSTEQFQNLLFEEFRMMDLSRPVWMEDESFCIGNSCMPEALFDQMREGPRYLLKVGKSRRIKNLMEEYGSMDPGKLILATRGIEKKLGGRQADDTESHITSGNLDAAASILLDYYDRRYKKSLAKSFSFVVATIEITDESNHDIAKLLIDSIHVR